RARPGLVAREPAWSRRAPRHATAAGGRLADSDPRLRGRRTRPDVALARGDEPLGTGPRRPAELSRTPARGGLRPEQPGARLCRRAGRRAAALRQELDPGRAPERGRR